MQTAQKPSKRVTIAMQHANKFGNLHATNVAIKLNIAPLSVQCKKYAKLRYGRKQYVSLWLTCQIAKHNKKVKNNG